MRRMALLLGAMLAALVALRGVAWATTIYCPNDPRDYNTNPWACYGTPWRNEMIGTDHDDDIYIGEGNDVSYGGAGNDRIWNDSEIEDRDGKDVYYGGPGKDRLFCSLDAERYYGGSGDDLIEDEYRNGDPDYIKCGRGVDTVYYNEGLDTVEADCEVLNPPRPE
jgi:Ca2+-binding RTX toxin-like protein